MTLAEEILAQWETVKAEFPWEECAHCFALMGWVWTAIDRTPSVADLKATADRLFASSYAEWLESRHEILIGSGRLYVLVSSRKVALLFQPLAGTSTWEGGEWW